MHESASPVRQLHKKKTKIWYVRWCLHALSCYKYIYKRKYSCVCIAWFKGTQTEYLIYFLHQSDGPRVFDSC